MSKISKLLSPGGWLPVNKHMAGIIGPLEAIFLGKLIETKEIVGSNEFYCLNEDIKNTTGIGAYQQGVLRKKLIELELITVNRKGVPAQNYYTLNEGNILDLFEKDSIPPQILKNGESRFAEIKNQDSENLGDKILKNGESYIIDKERINKKELGKEFSEEKNLEISEKELFEKSEDERMAGLINFWVEVGNFGEYGDFQGMIKKLRKEEKKNGLDIQNLFLAIWNNRLNSYMVANNYNYTLKQFLDYNYEKIHKGAVRVRDIEPSQKYLEIFERYKRFILNPDKFITSVKPNEPTATSGMSEQLRKQIELQTKADAERFNIDRVSQGGYSQL